MIENLRHQVRHIRQLRPLWGQIVFRFLYGLFLWMWKVPFQHHIYIKFPVSCRLGNQMFMTAFGETLRKRLGEVEILYYTYGEEYYLQNVDSWIYKRFRVLTYRITFKNIINEPSSIDEDLLSNLRNSLKEGNILISGYFENIKLFDIEYLKKIHPRLTSIKRTLFECYGDLSSYASIHVRRGDFVSMGVSISSKYYIKAMEYYPEDTKFIIISDDIEWCQSNLKTDRFRIVYANKHLYEKDLLYLDLYLPTLCLRGNILSCSSFSWWGSALTESKNLVRVMPTPWWTGETNKPLYFSDAIIIDVNKL